MSAAPLIAWAAAEGVRLEARDGRVIWHADQMPPADLLARLSSQRQAVLATLASSYRDRLTRSAGVPFEWLAAHYFTAGDLAEMEAGRSADPAALGELIRIDLDYPFGWCVTAPVAAPMAGRNNAPADPLAELASQGLELAGDDRAFIRQHLAGMPPQQRRATLATYARHWLAGMEGKPEHHQQNEGRFAANTWLRICAP